ncbi:hypothetical protein QTP86_007934 [Hemibagrus guttatus]|nr:hypothetical protein QTP86_007934 [Hemibagrus guttatus]
MDRISRRSQGLEGVRFGNHRISSLIFADDVVLLASSGLDLQHALGRFAAECKAAGMRVSTSKSEAMVLDRKKVACTLQVGGEVLPQVEEFKYLGVLFTSEGRMDREIDRRIGAAAAVMRSMYRSVVVKKELSQKAKLSIYQSIYVPTLTYGHELWVMTERVRSRIQAAEMSFLCRVAGRSLRDRVRSSVTREELGVEPLLLHIERGQLRWLGHLFRMPPRRLPGEVFRACPTGKRPRGRPRTRWRNHVFRLAWERLGVPPEELEEVARERELRDTILPYKLMDKLGDLGLPHSTCMWIYSFLTDHSQRVRVGHHTSTFLSISTGSPQGYVLSPLLYSLFTDDCTPAHHSNTIVKFADDITVVGLISGGDESTYRDKVEQLTVWCRANNLLLNTSKAKELVIDYRRRKTDIIPLIISRDCVERVADFRFLVVYIEEDLTWSVNTSELLKKTQQRLHFPEGAQEE